jgi:hypothetical protein
VGRASVQGLLADSSDATDRGARPRAKGGRVVPAEQPSRRGRRARDRPGERGEVVEAQRGVGWAEI